MTSTAPDSPSVLVVDDETGILEVTRHDIEEVISSWTGIPVAALQSEEAERLLKMEEILKLRVVGQDRSINAIIARASAASVPIRSGGAPASMASTVAPSGDNMTDAPELRSTRLARSQSPASAAARTASGRSRRAACQRATCR